MDSKVAQIQSIVKEELGLEATGHDWYHVQRVYFNALRIHEKEGGDRTIISYAALLHDISDHKFNGGDLEKGAFVAGKILEKLSIELEVINKVRAIITTISYSKSFDAPTLSLEAKIVQDADRLDAIGAIGIARTFAYGGYKNQPIYDPEIPIETATSRERYMENRTSTIHHFYDKLLLLKDRLNTSTARKMAAERHQFLEDFLTQFYKEWNME